MNTAFRPMQALGTMLCIRGGQFLQPPTTMFHRCASICDSAAGVQAGRALTLVCGTNRSMESFMKRLIGNFGWRIAVMMGVNYLLIKGLMMSVLGLIRLSYCKKTLGINGTQCQTMQAIAQTPWAIKGAFGVVSDAYPLFGYHKASYIIVSACMGTVAFFALATADNISVTVAATLLFAANFQIAVADLLCEGRYAALMQEKPHTGSTMVSYVWGCFQIGSLVAAMFVGPVADHYNPQVRFISNCVPWLGCVAD